MRMTRWFAPIALAAVVSVPSQAAAQLELFVAQASEGLDGESLNGFGARFNLGFPVLPVGFQLGADWFLPECGSTLGEDHKCAYAGAEANVTYAPIPVPFVTPYISGGIALRAFKPDIPSPEFETETGFALAIGGKVKPPAFPIGIFIEARKEWVGEDRDETILRAGIQIGG